jgi:nitrogen-specific signal transduction histidine kinase/CheY-like chemotaxis protein
MSDGGTICLRFDITEAKQREEQLRQSQKLEAVGHLAGGIAHDFNNMLTIVRSYAEFIVRSPDSTAKSKEDAKIINQTTVRAAALTQQLLAFSRRQVLRLEELGINRVVTEMEVMLRRLIGEHIDFATALDPGLHAIKADPSQMEQVILNLVVNSRDAMPKGGRLLIETANRYLDQEYALAHSEVVPGHYVMLAVTDSGVGIDGETQKHIFEPFFTTKPLGEGSGMGLATVYGIVKQMKGFIFVYSEPGQGATFKLYFPGSGGTEHIVPAAGPDADVTSAGGETVLLVEDEELVRRSAARILTEAKYTVLEAADVHDAIRIVGTHPGTIDVMLSDVVMPAMSGQELWERVRQIRPMRVMFMSGYTDDAVVRHGVLAGDVPFVAKPFTRQGLLTKLREALESPRYNGRP